MTPDKITKTIEESEKEERLNCPFCRPNTAYGANPEYFDEWRIRHDYHYPHHKRVDG